MFLHVEQKIYGKREIQCSLSSCQKIDVDVALEQFVSPAAATLIRSLQRSFILCKYCMYIYTVNPSFKISRLYRCLWQPKLAPANEARGRGKVKKKYTILFLQSITYPEVFIRRRLYRYSYSSLNRCSYTGQRQRASRLKWLFSYHKFTK